jgi:hypothetical protein
MTLGTECAKCLAAMPELARVGGWLGNMTITGFLCKECGHWNDLKRRKWWKENPTAAGKK